MAKKKIRNNLGQMLALSLKNGTKWLVAYGEIEEDDKNFTSNVHNHIERGNLTIKEIPTKTRKTKSKGGNK